MIERRMSADLIISSRPATLAPAHAVPAEYKGNSEKYVNLICDTMLSEAWKWFVGSRFYAKVPFFCDVFCEDGAFSLQI